MPLCKQKKEITSIEAQQKLNGYPFELSPDYSLEIFRSVDDLPEDWEVAQPSHNEFLQRPYLSVIEKYPPAGYDFFYLIFYKNKIPVGVCYCQVLEFKSGKMLRDENDNGFLTNFISFVKDKVIDRITIKTVVCGNALLTGEHGFYFKEEIPGAFQIKLVSEALKISRQHFEKLGEKLSGFFIKDFPQSKLEYCKEFEVRNFHRVEFQPSMVMDIPKEWTTFDDYLASFLSKYRTRAKRAFKKGEIIVKQEFNAERILLHRDRLFELYKNIENDAGFSLAELHPNYFCGLKQTFGDNFTLTGYWVEGELVGYYTTILNGQELEAHFLGFDYAMNREHQMYLNMLYDMVRQGIEKSVKRIVFARTAMEIKSSVGAVAEEMYCYTRHWNNLPNRFTPRIFSYLNPVEEWVPRSPFK